MHADIRQRPAHLAVLSPDPAHSRPLDAYLTEHGFAVSPVASAYRLDRLLSERGADLVILDDDLPDADPLALARRLSARNRFGILMLASGADCLARICSLEAGADDCLAKPAELREVLARVKAILRRLSVARGLEQGRLEGQGARFGDCRYDPASRRLVSGAGAPIPLTVMEQSLLSVFAGHPNRALTRDELVLLAHGRGWSPLDRSLDIRISRLRYKIERDPARPEVIVTVRGVGYRYEG